MNPLRNYSIDELLKELHERSCWVFIFEKDEAEEIKGEALTELEWEELKRDFDDELDNTGIVQIFSDIIDSK